MKNYLGEKGYKTIGLDNLDVLSGLIKTSMINYIIGGSFTEKDSRLICFLFIYNVINEKIQFKDFFTESLETHTIDTLDNLFLSFIEEFVERKIESEILTVKTDNECILYIDEEYYGQTPLKMRLLKGEYQITIIHKNREKNEKIFTKKINTSNHIEWYIDIKVFVQLMITTEEKCDVYINGRKKGNSSPGNPYKEKLYTGKEYQLKLVIFKAKIYTCSLSDY